jgi:hypothetical protein
MASTLLLQATPVLCILTVLAAVKLTLLGMMLLCCRSLANQLLYTCCPVLLHRTLLRQAAVALAAPFCKQLSYNLLSLLLNQSL